MSEYGAPETILKEFMSSYDCGELFTVETASNHLRNFSLKLQNI